ncbi:hypothetical protein [Paenisporosarcina sp. NPDC076898]|uniref:hypothetical protein n=1 Tax=unclassified Paenisporosarcina TaxID=2642018 RepID=UPI003CFCC6C9
MKKMISILVLDVGVFLLLHSTPHMALRTHVFFMSYPKAALSSGIIDDQFHNEIDQEKIAELNPKAYTLTKPPIEEATQGELRNFLVRKIGFLYFAEFYGEA